MTILDEPDLQLLDWEPFLPTDLEPVTAKTKEIACVEEPPTWEGFSAATIAWAQEVGEPYVYGGATNLLDEVPTIPFLAFASIIEEITTAITGVFENFVQALANIPAANIEVQALANIPAINIEALQNEIAEERTSACYPWGGEVGLGEMLEWICNCSPSRHDLLSGVEPVTCHTWTTGDD